MKNKESNKKNKRERARNNHISIYDGAIGDAISGYVSERGIWRRFLRIIDLHRKPWLLIAGSPRAGKTSLAVKSGLPYDFVYAGRLASGDDAPRWFFAEKAVYIDAPASLAVPQRWGEFCRALKKHKYLRRRTVDGLLHAVDISDFLAMDRARVKQLASDLRAQADALVSISGYEIPLYFVFTKSDKIEGFRELFSEKDVIEKMPMIGAVVGGSYQESQEAGAFSRRYRKICDEVYDLCLLKMINADDIEKNKPLCRLSSELLLAEAKISAFIAEFFKYRGRAAPRFCGFFLTSSGTEAAAHLSRILGDVIPMAKFKMREASAGTFGYWVKKVIFHLLMAMICAVAVFSIAGSGLRDALYMRTLEAELSALLEDGSSIENQYIALEKLRQSYNYLQGNLKSPGRLVLGTDKVRGRIRDAYVAASGQVMVEPAVRFLEASIARQRSGRSNELTAEEHQALYHSLKTYLLLTSGNQVKVDNVDPVIEIVEQALKNPPDSRYRAPEGKIIRDNINTVIRFAADGLYEERADQKIVRAARERLTAAPRAAAVYGAVMDRLRARRGFVPVAQIIGRNENLRYGNNVSDLYTREGWEQAVYAELINASKDPFKADWVMGPVKAQVDEAKLLSELVKLYSDDLCRRWLDFIRNTHVNLLSDMPSVARDLERLSSHDSEMRRMLAAVCSLATQEQGTFTISQSAPKSAADIKGQIANVSNKLRGSVRSFTNDAPDPFAEAKKVFGPVDNFLTGGAFDEYQRSLGELSEKIKNCDARGGFTQTFAVSGDEPLRVSGSGLNRAYASMPSAVSASLKRVLESPLDFTAGVLAKKISAELEESWNSEVVSYFNDKIAGRYPLYKNGSDVSWSDFEEFFRPQSGVLWKYYDRNLSGFIERTSRGYEKRPMRSLSIPLSINEDIAASYNRAEKIANNFFRNDGTLKRQDIIFYPFATTNGDAQLWIGEKRLDFQGGLPVTMNRTFGSAGDETIILRLTTQDRAQEEIKFRGEWGIMRFFNNGKIEKPGRDRYRITWRLNVRNIYTANITTVIQTNSEALFDESVMRGFAVPNKAVRN